MLKPGNSLDRSESGIETGTIAKISGAFSQAETIHGDNLRILFQ